MLGEGGRLLPWLVVGRLLRPEAGCPLLLQPCWGKGLLRLEAGCLLLLLPRQLLLPNPLLPLRAEIPSLLLPSLRWGRLLLLKLPCPLPLHPCGCWVLLLQMGCPLLVSPCSVGRVRLSADCPLPLPHYLLLPGCLCCCHGLLPGVKCRKPLLPLP